MTEFPVTVPTSLETAIIQFSRLFEETKEFQFNKNSSQMSRRERVIRIAASWILLIFSKLIAITTPLFFQSLVAKASETDSAVDTLSSVKMVIEVSALGLMIGYCASRLSSGVIQLVSEFILFPATSEVAQILPNQSFSAALRSAYKRNEDNAHKKKHSVESAMKKNTENSASEKGTAAYARRVIDRGLRSSNHFLYRSIFNLLPSYVESFCIIVLISYKTSRLLGVTSGIIAFSFVYITSAFMHYRVSIIRRQLQQEGEANGFAEDSLSLAETVASFGTMEIEEARYAKAIAKVSECEMAIRRSFSILKLIQTFILGVGTTALIYCAWISAPNDPNEDINTNNYRNYNGIAGHLMLSQSLFAQLCSVLNMVGQHFRDCVSAAEDLREMEELVRTAALQRLVSKTVLEIPSDEILQKDHPRQRETGDLRIITTFQNGDTTPKTSAFDVDDEMVSKYRNASLTPAPILEVKNVTFSYVATVPLTPRHNKADRLRKVSDAPIPERKVILKDVSFSIPSGGYSIGIVGPSGSGKSTLLRVLLGLESVVGNGNSGTILINGCDITKYNRVPFFSMVGQENDLFRGLNLMENVKYGSHTLLNRSTNKSVLYSSQHNTAASSEIALLQQKREERALNNAAEDSQLLPVVKKFKDGWQAAVGPRGRLLSGGERQRVCLARALYRQEISMASNILPGIESGNFGGCILLMDEVTSSLDAKTESIVTEAIMSRVRQGATAVLIAHRLSSVQKCDLIIVMRDGEIVERGTHAELIQNMSCDDEENDQEDDLLAMNNSEYTNNSRSIRSIRSVSNLQRRVGWYAEAWRLQSSSPLAMMKKNASVSGKFIDADE